MAVEVDEAAVLVDVDQRVDERALPGREQRGGKNKPCEEAGHYGLTC